MLNTSNTPERTRPFLAVVLILTLACLVGPLGSPAGAQYFGRNKVQYKNFDFKILKTANFDIYFYPEEQKGAELAARLSERWRARLGKILDHDLSGRQPLIIYASHPDFEQTNAIGGELGEGTGGVTEPLRRRMVLPFGGPLADTDHVIGHELVHAFQFDIAASQRQMEGGGGGMTSGIERLPLWFIEGMAEYLSLGPIDPNTAMWMRDAVKKEELPTIKKLDNPKYFPYRWGQAFWAYVAGRWGDEIVGELLRDGISNGDPIKVIEARTGVDIEQLSKDWHAALRQAYEPIMRTTEQPTTYGTKLTGGQKIGGELNVSPALSPDGKRMAFLSERDLFSIDIYVADTETGKVIERVSKTAVDPHFSSLQFISSAGAWDSTGQRLAFAAVEKGRPALAVWSMDKKKVDQEAVIAEVDEIYNPTWSPDGRQIAFSGMSQGLTDLYIFDLTSKKLKRLTNDAFADLQPAWSPDGSRIAFATDRFTSKLETLDIGDYTIGLIDPASGTISRGPAIEGSKNINPQWSADGRSLYFLSDFNGRTNIYRADAGGGSIRQITNLLTGVSGITATSPALSSAQQANRIAFSVFEDGGYQIYAAPAGGAALAGTAVMAPDAITSAMLPPQKRATNDVVSLLQNTQIGLGGTALPDVEQAKPKWGLEYAGQPSVGIGTDRFGTYASGGLAMYFSDLLGDHTLATAIQINQGLGSTSWRDIGGAVQYVNLKHRWNWGVEGDQTPYVTGAFQSSVQNVNGELAGVEETILFRQTSRGIGGLLEYPFSRAQRVEFSGGYRSVSFDQQTQIFAYSLQTGQVLVDETRTDSLGQTLRFGQTSAALVYDTSVFGATSPVLGQRYRLEVSPTIGTISFSDVLADYRRYVMPIPFYTLAARVMHYGRYGPDGEDPRLTPLFIGYPTLVRGYDVGSFNATECFATQTSTCPAFDRLVGSRIAVANLEFRFPLLRPFGLRRNVYGPVPVEAAFFADAGLAWDKSIGPFDDYRKPVSSYGAALRVNAFGFAVLEFDFARPLQRPGQGWKFGFSLAPGW